MMKAVLLATVLAACATEGIELQDESPTTPLSATTMTAVSGHAPIIATGGALAVRVEDTAAIGLSGSASQGFAVEPYELDRWPNTISPEYWVRANVAGAGSFEIVTSKGIATGVVHSADIARVAIAPVRYELDGTSPFALAANRSELEVQLFDAANRRLVDATLAIAGGTQTAWDTVTASGAITVGGDSLPERTFDVAFAGGVERIESVRAGNRTCFHAYAGATEVVVAMEITGGARDAYAQNCAIAADASTLRVRY